MLVILAAGLVVAAYVPYVRGIFAGTTRPHLFTWLIWATLTGIGAGIQFEAGAIPAALITTMSTVGCVFVSFLALQRGERHIVAGDYASLGASVAALVWWRLADDPFMAVLLIIATDAFGFLPTVRKSLVRPYEETVGMYGLNAIRFSFGLLTLSVWAPEAWLYPAYVVVSQGGFALLLVFLRQQRRVMMA